MFSSTVLDVAAGLVFVFLAVSLAASTFTEALASMTRWRARVLLSGMKELLNDPKLNGLALNVYNHALINPRADGTATATDAPAHLPSYIDPNQFADALLDITGITTAATAGAAQVQATISTNIQDPQLRQFLSGAATRAGGALTLIRDDVSHWFDSSMDRVSGVYKRHMQLISFLVAFTIVWLLNIDVVAMTRALWQQPMLTRKIAPIAGQTAANALSELDALRLPIGHPATTTWDALLLGYLITATATLFGAPFWFDTLQQFVRLKGSGPSPDEKRSGAAAAN